MDDFKRASFSRNGKRELPSIEGQRGYLFL